MPKLTIGRGVSGSGKTTWARAQHGAVVVSRDDLRVAAFGSDGPDYYKVDKGLLKRREDFITAIEYGEIERALAAGFDVISDNTNVEMKYAQGVANIGYRLGADVEIRVFDEPLWRLLERNKARAAMGGRDVPEDVIRKQYDRFCNTKNRGVIKPVEAAPYKGTPGKPKAILVDIDGTIAHMRNHRGPFEWHNVGKDEPDLNVMMVIEWIRLGMRAGRMSGSEVPQVILMSGRDRVCEQETRLWLESWYFEYDALFMRPEKDMRKDSIVKAELFDQHIRDNYDVVMVFDDRNQVVDMWRAMGLQVAQVAPGDF